MGHYDEHYDEDYAKKREEERIATNAVIPPIIEDLESARLKLGRATFGARIPFNSAIQDELNRLILQLKGSLNY